MRRVNPAFIPAQPPRRGSTGCRVGTQATSRRSSGCSTRCRRPYDEADELAPLRRAGARRRDRVLPHVLRDLISAKAAESHCFMPVKAETDPGSGDEVFDDGSDPAYSRA